jgi:ArsR family transcriptional regulator
VSDDRREKFVYYSLKRENKALMKILMELEEEVLDYPVLLEDRKGMEKKEYFLSQCGPGECEEGIL